jgi:hypothetical protein
VGFRERHAGETAVPRIAGSEFVFAPSSKTPSSSWSQAKSHLNDYAKSAEWRVHDLRRTVATGLQKLGIALQVTESVLDHISGSRAGVIGIYQRHNYASEKAAPLRLGVLASWRLVEGRAPGVLLPMRGTPLIGTSADGASLKPIDGIVTLSILVEPAATAR